MPGYLDQYGAGEEQRNRIVLRSILSAVLLVVLSVLAWYLLKNHHEETVAKNFVNAIRSRDYQAAYRAWGCTPEKPCGNYSFNKFMEDWGPQSPQSSPPDPAVLGLTDAESCNKGVLLTLAVNPRRQEKLWVDKGADSVGFAPYPVCPFKNPFSVMVHRTVGQLKKPLLK